MNLKSLFFQHSLIVVICFGPLLLSSNATALNDDIKEPIEKTVIGFCSSTRPYVNGTTCKAGKAFFKDGLVAYHGYDHTVDHRLPTWTKNCTHNGEWQFENWRVYDVAKGLRSGHIRANWDCEWPPGSNYPSWWVAGPESHTIGGYEKELQIKQCPASHPTPVYNNNGEIEICVKQKLCPVNQPNKDKIGNPISCSSGEKIQQDPIYAGSVSDALNYSTYYSSPKYDAESNSLSDNFSSAQGSQRNDNHGRKIELVYNGNGVKVYRAIYKNGFSHIFYGPATGTTFISNLPKSGNLITNGSNFSQVTPTGTTYNYNTNGQLTSRVLANGQTRTYTYTASGKLSTVTNHFGKQLQYFYNANDLLEKLITPDNQDTRFEYDANGNMTKILYPDDTPSDLTDNPSIEFLFENSTFPNHLTGKRNEKGVRFASWSYDDKGRAISSEHAERLEKVELDYSTPNQTRVTTHVSNTLSNETVYHYETKYLDGAPSKQLTKLEQLICTDCVIGNWLYEYDAKGYVNKSTSPSGQVTTFKYNADGLETKRTEAVGTVDEKIILSTWNSSRRMISSTQANLKIDYVYDVNGQMISQSMTDLVSNEVRVTTYTYTASGLLSSIVNQR